MDESLSLQEKYAPENACFGCGPANAKGLKIRSFPQGDQVIAHWRPESYHEAFPGVLNGGIIGTLLDCHCNWTAAWYLMRHSKDNRPPCTVTAEYTIKLLAPTPSHEMIELVAEVIESKTDRARVQGKLLVKGRVSATCEGLFVAVKPGHPAYHRW